MIDYAMYFVSGGVVVTTVAALARAGYPFLSGLALMFPSVTVVSFYFIGRTKGTAFVVTTAKSSLLAALLVWTPYMFTIIYLAPRLGVNNALIAGFIVFLILGSLWVLLSRNFF